jgi:hypothetical protein
MNNPYMQLIKTIPTSNKTITNLIKSEEIQNERNIPNEIKLNENEIKKTENKTNEINIYNELNEIKNLLQLKKHRKPKTNYYPITKHIFQNDILNTYPDFPEDKYSLIYFDGDKYYLRIKNKNFELNKINFLKFIKYINN